MLLGKISLLAIIALSTNQPLYGGCVALRPDIEEYTCADYL